MSAERAAGLNFYPFPALTSRHIPRLELSLRRWYTK